MTGAHYQEPYASLNPNKLVPMLEDGDFKLTESSAILKYLADKFDLAGLSEGPEAARQGQRDDGLAQHQFLSRLGLRAVLPAALPAPSSGRATKRRRRRSRGARSSRSAGCRCSTTTGSGRTTSICRRQITIADYFGAGLVTLGELIGCDFARLSRTSQRWLDNMKKLKTWPQVNEVFDGFKAQLKGQQFVRL